MPSSAPGSPLRKILPFWLAAVAVAAAGIMLLHINSVRIINFIEYPETNPALLAETYRREAEKAYHRAARHFAARKDDPMRAQKLKNDPALKKARQIFLKSLKLKPDVPLIYTYLSDLANFEGDLAAMHYYDGMRALAEGQNIAAIDAFNRSLSVKADFRDALEEKTVALIDSGTLEEAQKSLAHLFELSKPDSRAYFIKALFAARKGKTREYESALEEAIRIDPTNVKAAKRLASLFASRKEYGRAIHLLEQARPSTPLDANLLHRLGQIYLLKGDFPDAAKSLENALKLEKHSAPLYFDLARVYEKLGKKSLSTVMLKKAIEIAPRFKKRILFPDEE